MFTLSWMMTSLGYLARGACMMLLTCVITYPILPMKVSGSNVEQRYAISLSFKEGKSASNGYIRLQKVYGEHCMSYARVSERSMRLKTERTSIDY